MNRVGCFDPSARFKPQWAYETPEGYRDEIYLYPFSFSVLADGKTLANNLPLQLDDDVPSIIRAIVFPNVGLQPSTVEFPSFVRIRDSNGNPLSDGLVLAAGVYGLSGGQDQNAFGFPIEPEIPCSPGGTLLFDFLVASNGVVSFLDVPFAPGAIKFFAQLMGTAGNGLTIQLINPGAPNIPLSAALVGGIHVQVTLGTNGASAITSTVAQVAAIINSTAAVSAVMGAIPELDTTAVVTVLAQTALAAGTNGTTVTLNGSLIAVKRYPVCL